MMEDSGRKNIIKVVYNIPGPTLLVCPAPHHSQLPGSQGRGQESPFLGRDHSWESKKLDLEPGENGFLVQTSSLLTCYEMRLLLFFFFLYIPSLLNLYSKVKSSE